MFEWKSQAHDGEVEVLVDLDKVYMVRVERQRDHYYSRVHVRFVDGNEIQNAVPPELVQPFLAAYRNHLTEHASEPSGSRRLETPAG
jgi:hypothetical protein